MDKECDYERNEHGMRMMLAIWTAKISAIGGRIIGKKSSAGPGVIALKICPDLIKRLRSNIKNEVIVTCGTNGKTTTNNLLCSALTKSGYNVLCNNLGANMLGGIATAFALKCNWLGKFSADYACLEVDEASTVKVFEHVKPDYVVITNLFRDQLDRYGEIDMTVKVIKKAISNSNFPTLVLNGDDPVVAQFGIDYPKAVYFGIGEKVLEQTDDVREGRFCVVCGAEQKYNYYHYSQLGDYYCPNCGNKRPDIDFEAHDVNIKEGLKFNINSSHIELNYRGFYNIYNVLAVYSAMNSVGVHTKDFTKLLNDYKPQIGRMEEVNLGKPVILNLAKNPAGFNQAISTVLQDERKKDVIIAVNDKVSDGQDVSWLWDVDFEKIKNESLNSLTVSGMRLYDLALRFKYSDVNVDYIAEDMRAAIEKCLSSDAEVCYVLVNYTALFSTQNIMLEIKKEQDRVNEK